MVDFCRILLQDTSWLLQYTSWFFNST
jgi:hypothetical protein